MKGGSWISHSRTIYLFPRWTWLHRWYERYKFGLLSLMRFLMRKNLLGLWSSARRFFQRDTALFVSKHLHFMKQYEMCPSYWIVMNHYLSLNLCFYVIMVFVSRLVLASGLLLPALPASRADSLCVSLSQLSLSFDSLWDLVQRQSHSPRPFFWGFADVSMATTNLLRLCLLKKNKV